MPAVPTVLLLEPDRELDFWRALTALQAAFERRFRHRMPTFRRDVEATAPVGVEVADTADAEVEAALCEELDAVDHDWPSWIAVLSVHDLAAP